MNFHIVCDGCAPNPPVRVPGKPGLDDMKAEARNAHACERCGRAIQPGDRIVFTLASYFDPGPDP